MTSTAETAVTPGAGAFVQALRDLTDSELKALRGATGRPLGQNVAVYDTFCRLFRPIRRRAFLPKWACYLVATLFPWHQKEQGKGNLGDALRRLRPSAAHKENRSRADQRFVRLLEAGERRVLAAELAASVRRLTEADVPIDWVRLLDDLSQWHRSGQPVQHAWADSYFK